jgi:hypothetical protein
MLPAIARIIIKQAVFVSFAVVIMGAATGVFAANPVEIAAVTVPQGNICKSTYVNLRLYRSSVPPKCRTCCYIQCLWQNPAVGMLRTGQVFLGHGR